MPEPLPASRPSCSGAATPRVEAWLLGLAFCLPFCSPARLPPNPAFWGEWAAALLFGGWLVSRLWRQVQDVDGRPRAVTWLAMVFPTVAALLLAQVATGSVRSPIETLLDVAMLLLAGLVCVAATSDLHAGARRSALQAAAWGLLAAFGLNAVAVVLGWFGYGLVGFELTRIASSAQTAGLIGQANQLGTLAVLALVAGVYLCNQRLLPRWAWVGVVVLTAVVCAMTGSRIAVVEWLLATLLAWWHGRGATRPDGTALTLASVRGMAGSLLALVLAQLAWVELAQRMANPTVTALRGSFNTRLVLLRDGLQMGWSHLAFGVGNGNFAGARLFELTDPVPRPDADHAHNILVQTLAEWGLPGLLLISAAAVLLLLAALRRDAVRGAAEQVFPATAVLCLLAHSQVEHPLWFVNLLLPFAWFAGMLPAPTCFVLGSSRPPQRAVAALATSATLAAAALVAWDYGRLQSLAMRAAAQGIGAPDLVSRDSLAEISRIAVATLFPTEAALMQARSLAFNEDFATLKLDISERALRAVPGPETAARYVAFSALAEKPALGQALLTNLAARNAGVHLETREVLKMFASAHPRLAEVFVQPSSTPTDH